MPITENNAKSRKIQAKSSTGVAQQHRFKFTQKRVASLPAPPSGSSRVYYYDAEVRGLTLAISPGGKKTFLLYRKVNGRPERIPIGAFGDDYSVEGARNEARKMNGHIAAGKNPADERRAVRDEMTLRELFDTFLALYAKEHKRTWKNDEWMFNKYLHGWSLRRISTITKMDVVKLHAHIGKLSGPYAANRAIELLCSIFNRARMDWSWSGANPAAGIKPFKERKRARFLDGGELPAFFQSLAQEPNATVRDYILVSLLTGARRSNVQSMRWDEINWRRATWIIPAEKAKSDENIHVVLTPVVLQMLQTRKASSLSPWVFPGAGSTGHLIEPKSGWRRILRRAQQIEQREWLKANLGKTAKDFAEERPDSLCDLRLHDLRRTLGSWQAATGASLPIIGKSLGHESLEATKIYARLNLDPVRESVMRATQAMLVAGGVPLLKGQQ